MNSEQGSRPPLRDILSSRLANKIRAYGEQFGLSEEGVVDQIASQYPNQSLNQLVETTGFAEKSIRQMLMYAGVKILTVAESIELNKTLNRGLFGLTPEERIAGSRLGGQASAERGVGIHGLSPEEMTVRSKRAGSISGKRHYERGTGIFKLTDEQIREARKKGGNSAAAQGVGFFGMSEEAKKARDINSGKRSVELKTGIHGLSREQRQRIGQEAGRRSAQLGVGVHGVDPETGERWAVVLGKRSKEKGAGIHGRTLEQHRAAGIQASEVRSSQKVEHESNYFDSRVEAAAAVALKTFIPDFTIQRGENYQVIIPGIDKKVDFIIHNVLVEYNPIVLWYTEDYMGAFETQEEFDIYRTNYASLSVEDRLAYRQQVVEGLRQRYYSRRRAAIDGNADYRDKELLVVVDAGQLYDDVITRFGQDYPERKDFIRFFNSVLKLISEENKRIEQEENQA